MLGLLNGGNQQEARLAAILPVTKEGGAYRMSN